MKTRGTKAGGFDFSDFPKSEATYLGEAHILAPSGKYYTLWANSNVDDCPTCNGEGCEDCNFLGSQEAAQDQVFWEEMDQAALAAGGSILCEGTSVYFVPEGVEWD